MRASLEKQPLLHARILDCAMEGMGAYYILPNWEGAHALWLITASPMGLTDPFCVKFTLEGKFWLKLRGDPLFVCIVQQNEEVVKRK